METQEATLALRNALAQLVTLGDPTELQRQALEDLGITVRRTEEGMVDVLDVIRQLQGANLEQVLGLIPSVRAAAGILSLANNWERFGEILGEFAGTAGIVDQVSQDLAESTQVKLNQAVETVRQTFIKFGEALVEGGIVSRGVAFLQSGMEGFIRLIEENKEGIASFVELLITGVGAAGRIAADIAGGAGQALTEDVNKFVRGLSSERLRAIQQATAAANRERLLQDIGEFPFGGGRVRQESPLTTRFPVAELQAAAISELQRRDVLQELEERKEAIAEVNREFAELAKFARNDFPRHCRKKKSRRWTPRC
ncbi:MAG: phage tail tape measure protein [Acidobacteriota bacterium]